MSNHTHEPWEEDLDRELRHDFNERVRAEHCEHAGHAWVNAGGGLHICAMCETERFSDEFGF